jgi:hypothetical protein
MPAWQSFRDLFHPLRILWQNRSGFYCVGLDSFCPISMVTSLDYGREYSLIETRTGIHMLGLESLGRKRGKPNEQALEGIVPALRPSIVDAVRSYPAGAWAFVCPLPCRALPLLALELGCKSACHPADLCDWLNDKRNFFDGLDTLGLPRLPGQWMSLSNLRYDELRASIGAQSVAQTVTGSSGSGTAFIRSEQDLLEARLVAGDDPVWVAPEVQGPSINLNAIVLDRSVVVGCPNIQLVGLEMLGSKPGMYCGNDYTSAAALDASILAAVGEQTRRIGGWLSTVGYHGLFGLDFIVDLASARAYAVDLNPRWQGSTAVGAQAEARSGRLPLAAAEIAWRLGLLGEDEIVRHADQFFAPLAASQMSLRLDAPGWSTVTGEVEPGVYSSAPRAEFRRAGIGLGDLADPAEVLVTGAVPPPGYRVGPGSHLLRVYSLRPIINPASGQTLPWARQFASAMYEALRLEPAASTSKDEAIIGACEDDSS